MTDREAYELERTRGGSPTEHGYCLGLLREPAQPLDLPDHYDTSDVPPPINPARALLVVFGLAGLLWLVLGALAWWALN